MLRGKDLPVGRHGSQDIKMLRGKDIKMLRRTFWSVLISYSVAGLSSYSLPAGEGLPAEEGVVGLNKSLFYHLLSNNMIFLCYTDKINPRFNSV